jgi:hypothetical protein
MCTDVLLICNAAIPMTRAKKCIQIQNHQTGIKICKRAPTLEMRLLGHAKVATRYPI